MMKKIGVLALFLLTIATTTEIYTRNRGSGAGWFLGGLATGAILNSAAQRSDYSDVTAYIDALERENRALRKELRRCKSKLGLS